MVSSSSSSSVLSLPTDSSSLALEVFSSKAALFSPGALKEGCDSTPFTWIVKFTEATPAGFWAEQKKDPWSSGLTSKMRNSDVSCKARRRETIGLLSKEPDLSYFLSSPSRSIGYYLSLQYQCKGLLCMVYRGNRRNGDTCRRKMFTLRLEHCIHKSTRKKSIGTTKNQCRNTKFSCK